MSAITIHTEKNELIWNKASEFLINWLRLYHNIGQKTLLFLSGGSAVKLYERITKYELRSTELAIGQVDERFFGKEQRTKNKEQINAEVIGETGLWEWCEQKKIPYYLISQKGSLEQAAQKYNRQLKKLFEHFSYKIGVLGIGEDGHTAGLLPGHKKKWDVDAQVVGYECEGVFKQRITVTPKTLLQLDQAIVVAVGQKKKEAIADVINPLNIDNIDKYPAAILQKMKKVDLFADCKVRVK